MNAPSQDWGCPEREEEHKSVYHGKDVRPVDIVVKGSVSNPESAGLRKALKQDVKAK